MKKCECGCGLETSISKITRRGYKRGEHVRFIQGHSSKGKMNPFYRPVEERFWEKINKTNGCWFWIGRTNETGYGVFHDGKKDVFSHRFSYRLHKGDLISGLVIDHLCKNTSCVNPEHLELVSQLENVRRGNVVKLKIEEVKEIRKLYSTGKYTYAQLGEIFNTTPTNIYSIYTNNTWNDL